jgi:hypothetical protein
MVTKAEREKIEAARLAAPINPNETEFDRSERARRNLAHTKPLTQADYDLLDADARLLYTHDTKTGNYVVKPRQVSNPVDFARNMDTVTTTCAARIDAIVSTLAEKKDIGKAVTELKAETAFLRSLGKDESNPFPPKDGAKVETEAERTARERRETTTDRPLRTNAPEIERSKAERESRREP